jgi:hypothetical protein
MDVWVMKRLYRVEYRRKPCLYRFRVVYIQQQKLYYPEKSMGRYRTEWFKFLSGANQLF